ncbi:MAG: RES family NAD+ phosphorylase [Opitutaceae bacterium]|nr:RES family NAD+ phosphorylase [Opitutaceae bacterium]
MLTGWRLVKNTHVATAFSGDGAARASGRWNSYGRRVVYASSSRALAILETLVHLDQPVRHHYALFRIEFTEALAATLAPTTLPPDWRIDPPSRFTQQLGDHWLLARRSAILTVPSAVIPDECNYLLNPTHPDFSRVKIGQPEPFSLDPRLAKA